MANRPNLNLVSGKEQPAKAQPAKEQPKAHDFAIGQNVVARVDGGFLYLRIDLNQNGQPSSTGKTLLVGHTSGAVPVQCDRQGLKASVIVTVPNR